MADLDLAALRAKAEAATPIAWMGWFPGAGSVSSHHELTRHRSTMENWGSCVEITPLYDAPAILALVARVEKAEALIAKAGENAPVYKSVEKILDEHSAWIARPDRKVTEVVALAAVIAADLEAGASHVLGALHERCDAAEAENAHLRALLARAVEALRPFADFEPTLREWRISRYTIKEKWPAHRPFIIGTYPLDEQCERRVEIYSSAFVDASDIAREIEEAIGHD